MLAIRRSVPLLAALVVTAAACEEGATPPADNKPPEGDTILAGDISTAVTLDASKVYVITGVVSVKAGASLTIPAGTTLVGSTSVVPSALFVQQGGQIFSNGTAANPVVFTSGKAPGSRERGDWGGVVLNGRSICNFLTQPSPESECVSEGVSGEFGANPPVLDDNSGSITYTRIEFAGYEATFGNELNALTLNGVGSGTVLHHIQTHFGLDDGFEWFGGTVNLKYALATGIADDSFDYSTGWQGYGQFWIAQQDPNDPEADQGFEVDGNENDSDATPYTDPMIYNVTLVGGGAGAGNSDIGMLFRLGTSGEVRNAIVMGFQEAGVDIDNAQTVGRVSLQNSIIGLNAVDVSADGDGIDDPGIVADAAWNNQVGVDPMLAAPYNVAAPDFRPTAGSPALAGYVAAPGDPFFTAVDYIGAADPDEATPWYTGWTTTAQN
jgi:hypothetical protein